MAGAVYRRGGGGGEVERYCVGPSGLTEGLNRSDMISVARRGLALSRLAPLLCRRESNWGQRKAAEAAGRPCAATRVRGGGGLGLGGAAVGFTRSAVESGRVLQVELRGFLMV